MQQLEAQAKSSAEAPVKDSEIKAMKDEDLERVKFNIPEQAENKCEQGVVNNKEEKIEDNNNLEDIKERNEGNIEENKEEGSVEGEGEDNENKEKDEESKEENKGEEEAGDKENKERKEVISKKYTSKDVYKMVSLVLRYPSGGHKGETFWVWMVKIYGDTLLEGRNSNGLRNRWRKILKEHSIRLDEYKKKLTESLTKEFIDDVEQKIAEAAANVSKYGLSSKAYTSLFPDISRPEKLSEKGIKKKKLEDGNGYPIQSEGEKKRKNFIQTNKNHIDLTQLASKQPIDISKLFDDFNLFELQKKIMQSKNIVMLRDLKKDIVETKNINEPGISNELMQCKKIESNLSEFIRKHNLFLTKSNKEKAGCRWTELEDLVLKHPENNDMIQLLIKTKGIEEIEKRKKDLNLS